MGSTSGVSVPKISRNDCSQVPVWEVSAVLRPFIERLKEAAEEHDYEFDLSRWTAPIEGLSPRQVTRILNHEEPMVGLRVVDLICTAMGEPYLIHTFTFVPGTYAKYAKEMAYEEYMAEHDEEPPADFLEARSAELRELRERVLAQASVVLGR